jgi:hypothetical protein
MLALGIGNDHHREERNQRGEQHAVDENHEAGALQVLELGKGDFAIHLGQALLAAHGQQRMAQADQDGDKCDLGRNRPFEPPQRVRREMQIAHDGERDGLVAASEDGYQAPGDEDHHHHRGDLHDAEGLFARFVNADDVLAPEINRDRGGKNSGEMRRMEVQARDMQVVGGFVDQNAQVEARADGADGAGQYVIEHQRRDRKLGQRAAHGLVHHLVHAPAHEHRTAFDVDGAHGVGEQHDAQDEPGRGLADRLLRDAAHVVGRRGQVAEHDGGGAPERDERQHDGGGYNHLHSPMPLLGTHETFSPFWGERAIESGFQRCVQR